MELRYCSTHGVLHEEDDIEVQCKLPGGPDYVSSDQLSRQRAEEALMEGFNLGDDQGCQCSDCHEIAGQMVDTVIEAWRGR